MPLNYSKWDQLELSDDSDIEGHPNVDKKSLIRWKQRDIHEKRKARKANIANLRYQLEINGVMCERLSKILADVKLAGRSAYNAALERLKTEPSSDKPPTGADNQPTYDQMIESVLLIIRDEVKSQDVEDGINMDEALVAAFQAHFDQLQEAGVRFEAELEQEEREQQKKITSEDLYEGWDSKYVPPKPEPAPIVPTRKVTKEVQFETLNPKAALSSQAPEIIPAEPSATTDDDESLPELTPNLREFSKLKIKDYDKSWQFIQEHRDIFVPGATDALLVEAFTAERRGEKKYAKQCIHQGLLLQYCDKLGKDGVNLFFKRMAANEKRVQYVFLKDVEDTYTHLATRVAANIAEEEANPNGRETIQLMQEDPLKPITFDVPDGPPPEDIRLEGPGTETLDIEEVRRALQARWDVFQSFSPKLQEALKVGTLEAVNPVLAEMDVIEAEEVVKLVEMAGILSLSDGGRVRDMTGANVEEEIVEEEIVEEEMDEE
ncbi:hsp90-like protein [Hysterangium stoloniferum]|nr:hsp90-like protein [Hysterangium stoloniferum]